MTAPAERPSWKRKLLGWALLVLGVLGLVLPFLQGFLFLALGVFVLRHQYAWAHRAMLWLERRFPKQVQGIEGLEARMTERVQGWMARLRRRAPEPGPAGRLEPPEQRAQADAGRRALELCLLTAPGLAAVPWPC